MQPPAAGAAPSAPKAASVQQEADEPEEITAKDPVLTILAGVGLAAAVVALVTHLMVANIWINAEDSENKGQWTQLLPF
jgi:hypothetical protein